jgi:hypothetical protein
VAEESSFSLADTNVKYGIDLRRAPVQKFEGSVFEGECAKYEVVQCPCNLPELVDIAKISWSQTKVAIDRFHADTGLPENLADDVYTEWLKNSLTAALQHDGTINSMSFTPVFHPSTGLLGYCISCTSTV